VRESIHEQLERDGVTVGCVVGLALVSRSRSGKQRASGIELMDVILKRVGFA
jgi:glutamine amidotransferase PdxT